MLAEPTIRDAIKAWLLQRGFIGPISGVGRYEILLLHGFNDRKLGVLLLDNGVACGRSWDGLIEFSDPRFFDKIEALIGDSSQWSVIGGGYD